MSVIDNLLPQEIINKVKKLRAYFQQSLLSWIRNSDEHSRQTMHKVLQQISQLLCNYNDDNQQQFWHNTTQDFIVAIANPNKAKNPQIRKLCSRIDKQLSQLCDGNLNIPNDLMQELVLACQSNEAESDIIVENNNENLVENVPTNSEIKENNNSNNNNNNCDYKNYEIIEKITINSNEINSNEKSELLQQLTEITNSFYVDCDEIQNNINAKLFSIYLSESSRKLRKVGDVLNNLKNNIISYNVDIQNEINRELHTLKGDSYLAGITPIGNYFHQLESILKIVTEEIKILSQNNNSNDKKNAYLILLQAENKHNINNAGILIYKSLGLKNSTSFPLNFLENNNSDNNTWHQQATDKENNIWNILSVKELLNDEKFFNINTF